MVGVRPRVLVAGIGGASLGTEILKCLRDADRYTVFGCDISKLAYGHYEKHVAKTFLVDRTRYVESVLDVCVSQNMDVVVPGGEEPMVLLGGASDEFQRAGVRIAANSPSLIATCSDKGRLFRRLGELGVRIPFTIEVNHSEECDRLGDVPYPCVIKPAIGTGGSRFVFLASNSNEGRLYLKYVLSENPKALLQEYVSHDEGEFTVGVLSLPTARVAGSIAMRRLFHAKLSVLTSGKAGLISTGYSQGLIDEFPELRAQAESVAMALDSTGPLNIQGRVRGGIFLPFEINPRFSASTYLRAMAGFNEVDVYLRNLLVGEAPNPPMIRPGYYLRSLSEIYVPK